MGDFETCIKGVGVYIVGSGVGLLYQFWNG
jgi:hypothetical protein